MVIDLSTRITKEWEVFHKNVFSQDSLIYVNDYVFLENASPSSINLTVGDQWYDEKNKKSKLIPEKGIKVKAGESVILYTQQRIGVPYNAFGVIYGTGNNIFKAGFISTGKINPGFNDFLKIGFYNGSKRSIIFTTGDLLACCSFFEIETTLNAPLERYSFEEPQLEGKVSQLFSFLTNNWYAVVSVILSIIAIIVTLLS